MICYNENYYDDLSDLVADLDLDDFKEGDTITVEDCTLEPMIQVNSQMLVDALETEWEERQSEDCNELDKLRIVFEKNINFEKLNRDIPKLWYPNGKEIIFTYEEIIEEANK